MNLLTKQDISKLQQQYCFGNDLDQQKVVVKIYDPFGPKTWYILNQNPEAPDHLMAIVRDDQVELSIVFLSELEAYKGMHLGLPLDSDPYFMPLPAREVWERLQKGEQL
jgi:hypothetical protein